MRHGSTWHGCLQPVQDQVPLGYSPSRAVAVPVGGPGPQRSAASGTQDGQPVRQLQRGSRNMIRLNKRMAELGLCSRREADDWIAQGLVLVDGQVATIGLQVGAALVAMP